MGLLIRTQVRGHSETRLRKLLVTAALSAIASCSGPAEGQDQSSYMLQATLSIGAIVLAALGLGWLAGRFITKGYGFGPFGNTLVGAIGAFIGYVIGVMRLGWPVGAILGAVIGAVILVLPLRFFKRRHRAAFASNGETPTIQPQRNLTAPLPATPAIPHRPADVFVSYKREERARVEAIVAALRDLQFNVWFDARLTSGHHFDEEINREVRAAGAVLVCWSKAAVGSEWVRAEASVGRQRGVLTACFLEECEPYTPFNLIHAEDLSTGPLNAANTGWLKIVEQLGQLVGRTGVRSYLELPAADRSASAAWLAEHANDPLADAVLARLRQQ